MRFVTYNWGLLGSFFVNVPEYGARSQQEQITYVLRKLIVENRGQILFLQEIWDQADLNKIQTSLKSINQEKGLNYKAYNDRSNPLVATGLVVIMDQSILSREDDVEFKFAEYKDGDTAIIGGLERVGGKKRGLLYTTVTLKGNQRFLFGDTHLTALTSNNAIRAAQFLRIKTTINENEGKFDFFVLGCDLNFSPEFQQAIETEQKAWQENADLFVTFFDELDFLDAFRVANPLTKTIGYTWQRGLNHLISGGNSAVAQEPEQRTDVVLLGTSRGWSKDGSFIHVPFAEVLLEEPLLDLATKTTLLSKKIHAFPKDASGLYDFTAKPTNDFAPVPPSDHFAVIAEGEFFIK